MTIFRRFPPFVSREVMASRVADIGTDDVAAEIVRLGKVRRGELADETTLPAKGTLARQILDAAKKARSRT